MAKEQRAIRHDKSFFIEIRAALRFLPARGNAATNLKVQDKLL